MKLFDSNDLVGLCPIEREDLELLAAARNDPSVRLRTREHRGLNMIDQEQWLESISHPHTTNFMFKVVEMGRGKTVGVVGLCHWSSIDRTAETSLYAVPGNERHGFISSALTLLHDWGFDELGLERIWAEVYDFNDPCIALLTGLGFQVEGVLRSHVFTMGKRHDSMMMGLLKTERLTS